MLNLMVILKTKTKTLTPAKNQVLEERGNGWYSTKKNPVYLYLENNVRQRRGISKIYACNNMEIPPR